MFVNHQWRRTLWQSVPLSFFLASLCAVGALAVYGLHEVAASEYFARRMWINATTAPDFVVASEYFGSTFLLVLAAMVAAQLVQRSRRLRRLAQWTAGGALVAMALLASGAVPQINQPSAGGLFERWAPVFAVAALAFLLRASSAQTDSPPNGHPARLIAAGLVVFALPWTTLPLRVALLAHRTPHGPNIIVISADTLRVDQVGCFGQTDDLTPNLDRFAQDAVRFTQAVSSSSWTLPAHATLFTGLRPSRTETWTAFSPVPWRFDTLAEILREAGYHTVAFTGGGVMGRFFRFDQGFDLYWTVPASQGISFNPRESRTITRQAMHWLSKQDGRPFFLFLHTYQTHCPYWKQEGPGPAEAVYCPCTRNQPERQRPECLATYQGNVRFLDDQLGVFFQNLKDRGLYDDAMIVFMSDHGESFLQDQRPIVEHAFLLTEELIHVPLMVKLPRNRQAGAVRDVQVRMMDIFPTVLEIAGLAARRVDGVTLTPVIDGGEQGHRQAVAEFQPMVLAEGTPIQHAMNVPRLALRQPDHKLVRQFAPDKTEFFDLRADPHELADLLANAAWKPTPAYERMQAALTLFDFVPLPSPSAGAGQTLTREAEEQLKGLGYLH